jgi:hypothetical protein
MYLGNRILGDVTVGISNAQFSANEFGAVTFTINATVTGVQVDISNLFQSGATVVNNGAGNNAILRSVGAAGEIEIKFGADASEAVLKIAPTTGRITFPDGVLLENTMALLLKNAAGGDGASLSKNVSGDVFLANSDTDRTLVIQTTGTGSGSRVQFGINGVVKAVVDGNGIVLGASGGPSISRSTGSPEGAVTAPVGSVFVRTDGTPDTTFYFKITGAGNTGWVPLQSVPAGIVSKGADYTLTASDRTVVVDASGAARTMTLPAAASHAGRIYTIKKTDSSANTVTIDGNASETIDGATTKVLTAQFEVVTIQCDGANWHIIG